MKDKFGFLNIPGGTIRLSITNRCNMDCFYCHNEGQEKNKIYDLSYAHFVQILDTAINFGLRGISFSGGEPLLNKDFNKMLKYAVCLGLPKIDICTNGILLQNYIDILKTSKNISLVIGVDTCRPDEISKQSRAGKPFSYIDQNLKLLKRKNITFCINTVYTRENKTEIYEIIEFCRKRHIDLRIIEMDTLKKISQCRISTDFKKFVTEVSNNYNFILGFFHPGKGFYSKHKNGAEIYFYYAKCHVRDCLNCAKCQFRIDSLGQAIPCYARNCKIPLICNDKEQSFQNFLYAIYNLGIPPEKEKEGIL